MAKRQPIPQPLRALRAFVREARKAEKAQVGQPQLTAGEMLWGYTLNNGGKLPHRMAVLTDNFVDACNKYFEF